MVLNSERRRFPNLSGLARHVFALHLGSQITLAAGLVRFREFGQPAVDCRRGSSWHRLTRDRGCASRLGFRASSIIDYRSFPLRAVFTRLEGDRDTASRLAERTGCHPTCVSLSISTGIWAAMVIIQLLRTGTQICEGGGPRPSPSDPMRSP